MPTCTCICVRARARACVGSKRGWSFTSSLDWQLKLCRNFHFDIISVHSDIKIHVSVLDGFHTFQKSIHSYLNMFHFFVERHQHSCCCCCRDSTIQIIFPTKLLDSSKSVISASSNSRWHQISCCLWRLGVKPGMERLEYSFDIIGFLSSQCAPTHTADTLPRVDSKLLRLVGNWSPVCLAPVRR